MPRKPNEHLSVYLLKLVGLGSLFLLVSILSPQLPYLVIKALLKKRFGAKYNNKQIGHSIRYLKRKKFIALENKSGKIQMVLTKLGLKHLQNADLDMIKIAPHAWDAKWRIVMFDIPEEHKPARHVFRRKLKELGFVHFQRSVFLLPFKCEKEIYELAEHLSISSYVHILSADRFPNDKSLLKRCQITH